MDLLAYYERHNITDFPKRTNGTPDMRKAFNKRFHASLLFLNPPAAPTEVQPKSQMECPVCYEKLEKGKGKVVLGCDHTFCIDCFTKFMYQMQNHGFLVICLFLQKCRIDIMQT